MASGYNHGCMIGLMDCNNFFVSCERLFRPDLTKKPVAVLSSNDGCIVSRSQEVKDLGIPMGIPYFQIKDMSKKHDITVFSSNFALYRDVSSRVMHALHEEFDMCEVYSVDEAFFEVPNGMQEGEIIDIRSRIMQKTGIPVSFGVGATKTIAKMASTFAKKASGVSIFGQEDWNKKTSEITCGSVWGIGRQTTKKLSDLGIKTVADFLRRDHSYFAQLLGILGERLYLELSGTPVYCVQGVHDPAEHQSIASTRSFHAATHERSVLLSALGYHTAHIGEKLRKRKVTASSISVVAAPSRFGDFGYRKWTVRRVLETPTNDTRTLLKEVILLLDQLYDPEVPYKKAGVMVGGIVPEAMVAPRLFDLTENSNKNATKLYDIADRLNARFGNGTIVPGIVSHTEKWSESKRLRSPEYTTKWSHIASVKAV